MKGRTLFNTLTGYVTLVIPPATFLTMHMSFSTETTLATDARLPQRSGSEAAAHLRTISCAGTLDAGRAESFKEKMRKLAGSRSVFCGVHTH